MEMKSQVLEGGNLLNRIAIACEGHEEEEEFYKLPTGRVFQP